MGINIDLLLVKWEFETMTNYLDLVAEAIDQRLDDIEERYNEIVADTANEFEESMISDRFIDEFFQVRKDYPSLLLTSFIIAWYSFVEQQLIRFCQNLEHTIAISAEEKTNVDKGVRFARRFLEESANYVVDNNHWQELVRIGKLRNVLYCTWS